MSIRKRAIRNMKHNQKFLGRGTHEMGQTLNNSMNYYLYCYVCRGMMGFKVPIHHGRRRHWNVMAVK